jgi:copper chaperone
MTNIYRVAGMTCEGCVRAVTNAIQLADPKAAVEVDLSNGEVSVDSPLDSTAIATAVDGAGFTFEGLKG